MEERKVGTGVIQSREEIARLIEETQQMARRKLTPEGLKKIKEDRDRITALTMDDLKVRFNI